MSLQHNGFKEYEEGLAIPELVIEHFHFPTFCILPRKRLSPLKYALSHNMFNDVLDVTSVMQMTLLELR